ncbi:hypothetical protein [Treponema parvum]|uniref:hypothetical protein n=1 Tax=Treponema parvum TaxID=138851 RepID=UPI001AEC22DE|nr:hypothetical protein [Treponema parvum]QTQ15355.1 hypothetical protein HXT04_00800 [Treponema parvum]
MTEVKNLSGADVIVEAAGKTDSLYWGFNLTRTGQLDFCGKIEGIEEGTLEAMQTLDGSPYFSSAWYTYMDEALCRDIRVYLKNDFEIADADMFAFLTHVGALLLAVEGGDSLLAAELLARRTALFMNFPQLTLFIVKPVAAEALFAWIYGRTHSDAAAFAALYKKNAMLGAGKTDTGFLLYCAAKEVLKPDVANETPEQMFIRYFKNHNTAFTIGIVGTNFYGWNDGSDFLDDALSQKIGDDILNGTQKVRDAKKKLYASLRVSVQAEPYNPHDANAVSVSAEDVCEKARGDTGLQRAGYIRATGAAILRAAKPNTFRFNARLARIGDMQNGRSGIVVRVEV